ncbi:galactose oxidase [Rhizophagus irregularis]|uniref:Galactose oxidase n=1 Tax=Rhizophagus irregularis TaxID=588596 RepID=A0A2N0S939_9GLOM|nr:galactose oxidase [Rhizophagus irregularis]CAB4478099.1 unnamed protein product [Rhizophagus irregularis]CAB5325279.1 unnamed protein product [Rhizophagus irregularis]
MGCKFLNHHLMLVLLIQLFLLITLFVNGQFIPGPRSGHTATLIGNKIYFIGGYNFTTPKESDIFYYNGIAWVELNNQVSGQGADMPPKLGHTANVGGRNQDLIFIIGGDEFSKVYQLDTKTNNVTSPTILGVTPIINSLVFMSSVSYGGKIYLFGGGEFDIKTDLYTLQHSLFIFNTINLNWEDGSQVGAPPPRYRHTATLVNELIYYIGGIQMNNSYVSYPSMSDIYRYSTISNTWSSAVARMAPGNTPGPRLGHSAVLVEGKICIFGGSIDNLSPKESIAMLDTSTLEWSIPSFKNPRRPNMPTLPNLIYHTATLVDKRMLVAFGNDTDKSVDAVNGYKGLNNDFYIFDFNDFQWYITTADELTNPSSNIPKLFSSSSAGISSNKPLTIALLSVGIILGVAIVGTVIFVYYRRKKNQSKNDVGYPADYVSYPADDSNISYDKFSFSQRSTLYSSQPSMQYQSTNQHQQFTPEQRISNNNNLTQPQGYIGQEYSILRIPSDDDRLSNHRPGSGTGAYSQRSEAPLPPPPSTDPHSQGSEAPFPSPLSTDSHSQGSEAPLPPPPSTDSHSQGSEAPPLPSPPLTDPHSQGSKALLPPPPPPKTP